MGAKTWMLVSAEENPRESLKERPELNRKASLALAARLFPSERFEELEDGSISYTNPPDDEVYVGDFEKVAVVAASEFGLDYPSKLPKHFLRSMPHRRIILHAMHSVVDWFAFAVWEDKKLVRAISLSPDSGILEDSGERFPFEAPFWAGERPVGDGDEEEQDRYPFVFHPLDLGEAALAAFFGYVIEGAIADCAFEPEDVPLLTLKRLGKASG